MHTGQSVSAPGKPVNRIRVPPGGATPPSWRCRPEAWVGVPRAVVGLPAQRLDWPARGSSGQRLPLNLVAFHEPVMLFSLFLPPAEVAA